MGLSLLSNTMTSTTPTDPPPTSPPCSVFELESLVPSNCNVPYNKRNIKAVYLLILKDH